MPAGVARAQEAPDLGRDDELGARAAAERAAEPPLRQAGAVVRRGVEVPQAQLPGAVDDRGGLVVVDSLVQTAERRGAERKPPDLDHSPYCRNIP